MLKAADDGRTHRTAMAGHINAGIFSMVGLLEIIIGFNSFGAAQLVLLRFQHIFAHHDRHQFIKRDFRLPAKIGFGFGWIAQQKFNFGEAKIEREKG